MLTIGSEEDYNYFVPRLLELAIHAPLWIGTEPERLAGKDQKWPDGRAWPAAQRAAIIDVFELAHALSEREDNEEWGNALVSLKEVPPPGSKGYGPPKGPFRGHPRPAPHQAVKQVLAQRVDLQAKFTDADTVGGAPLTAELVRSANIIFTMEKHQRASIQRRFPADLDAKRVVCLDVPKKHTSEVSAVVQLLEQKIERFLPRPGAPDPGTAVSA